MKKTQTLFNNQCFFLPISLCVNIEFHQLDCQPFYHGHGKKCIEKNITIGIWTFSVEEITVEMAIILFYVTQADGFLPLGIETLHQSDLLGSKKIFTFLPMSEIHR